MLGQQHVRFRDVSCQLAENRRPSRAGICRSAPESARTRVAWSGQRGVIMRRQIATVAGLVTAVLVAAALAVAAPASAAPGTVVTFAKGASATRYQGGAFDACAAPPLSTMIAWNTSPYRAIGVYVGGPNRTCAQPNLTAAWVGSVTRRQWQLLPIYMGLQAPCSDRVRAVKIVPATAAAQGTSSATDAIAS